MGGSEGRVQLGAGLREGLRAGLGAGLAWRRVAGGPRALRRAGLGEPGAEPRPAGLRAGPGRGGAGAGARGASSSGVAAVPRRQAARGFLEPRPPSAFRAPALRHPRGHGGAGPGPRGPGRAVRFPVQAGAGGRRERGQDVRGAALQDRRLLGAPGQHHRRRLHHEDAGDPGQAGQGGRPAWPSGAAAPPGLRRSWGWARDPGRFSLSEGARAPRVVPRFLANPLCLPSPSSCRSRPEPWGRGGFGAPGAGLGWGACVCPSRRPCVPEVASWGDLAPKSLPQWKAAGRLGVRGRRAPGRRDPPTAVAAPSSALGWGALPEATPLHAPEGSGSSCFWDPRARTFCRFPAWPRLPAVSLWPGRWNFTPQGPLWSPPPARVGWKRLHRCRKVGETVRRGRGSDRNSRMQLPQCPGSGLVNSVGD